MDFQNKSTPESILQPNFVALTWMIEIRTTFYDLVTCAGSRLSHHHWWGGGGEMVSWSAPGECSPLFSSALIAFKKLISVSFSTESRQLFPCFELV